MEGMELFWLKERSGCHYIFGMTSDLSHISRYGIKDVAHTGTMERDLPEQLSRVTYRC